MSKNLKDQLIVDKIIKKDESTLLKIYREYHDQLFNFIYRQTKDYHVSQELTQDTFLDFIESLRDFRFQSSLKTYLFSIAKNKSIDWIRKKKLKKILFSALPDYIVEGLKVVFMDDQLEQKALKKKIKQVFDELPNDYRLILRQKYQDGEKVTSIAKKLRLGFKATESLLFRARAAFMKIFNSLP